MAMRTLLLAACLSVCAAAQQSDFTVVVLPDTQKYSASYPQIFKSQTQWIRDHVTSDNIKLVIGVGDIVDGGASSSQWLNANAAIKTIDGIVPYVLAIGNHDYDKSDRARLKRAATNFNKYFGPARYAGRSHYGGNYRGSNENFYAIVNLGGKDTLLLVLEFMPRAGAVNWAKGIIEDHQDKEAWIVTHAFGYSDGRITTCDPWSIDTYGLNDDNDGQELWDSFVSQYPNISLVLSGHVTAFNGIGRRTDYGINGNLVQQVLSDYQNYTNGGNGYLRIMKFRPSLNRIEVKTYSPYVNAFFTDSANQFTMQYRGQDPGSTSTILRGRVYDTSQCTGLTGATVADDQGHSTTTDSNGYFTLAGLTPGQVKVTASKNGFGSASKTMPLNSKPGYVKFALGVN